MKSNDKNYEKLNEYLDGEMTESEAAEFEKLIAVNADLRTRFNELKAVKQRVKESVKEIPESPYFETRLYASLNEQKTFWQRIKRYTPALGITMVTLCLMFVLKYHPQLLQNIVEEQSSNIAGFYKQNLQPLLYAANLSNEDVFNFAFYHQLPLDKKNNQYLHLGYDPKGNEFFEIKSESGTPKESNLANFVKALDLNADQKDKVDSILQAYAADLESQVLVNEQSTVAINPNIWNYNKALLADLLSFAEVSNKKEFNKIVPAGANFASNEDMVKIVRQVKASKRNEYIFFTPDTIFSEPYEFDKNQFAEEMKLAKKELKNSKEELKRVSININLHDKISKIRHGHYNTDFNILVDSNALRVNIPENSVPEINMPDMEGIAKQIERATKNFKVFTFEAEPMEKGNFNFKYRDENGEPFDVHINLDSLVQNPHIYVKPPKSPKGQRGSINMDSLFSSFRMYLPDSMSSLEQQEFRQQMKQLEKEMRRFREEMMDMKREFREKPLKKQNEPLEI